MEIPFVDLKSQYLSIKKEIDESIFSILEKAEFIGGKALSDFNINFAKFINVKHSIGVGNGTEAITIALKALGISTGDEVIVPANSFIATSEAVTAAGGKVVFVDCHPETYSIDTSEIEKKLTQKTKAIIPVHLYGQPANMDEIIEIASRYNLKILEDSAQAHGARYKNNKIGSLGNIATFSFYPGKNLGAYGDGGAIVTNDDNLANNCKMYANHGRIEKYNHKFEGVNSRLDSLQAAVLNVKLKYIDTWNEKRREVASLYRKYLSDTNDIILPLELENTKPVYHLFVIRTTKRDELQEYLKKCGISTGVHYPIGLPFLSAYKYLNHKPKDFPVTYQYQNEIISLPIYPEMTEKMIGFVAESIKSYFHR